MRHLLIALRSTAALAAALTLAATSAAGPSQDSGDRPAALLETRGEISVGRAGPYVHAGTFRIQVSAKLGRPDAVLPDGTWIYYGYAVPGSDASGSLVVRFDGGRVRSLALATRDHTALIARHAGTPTRTPELAATTRKP